MTLCAQSVAAAADLIASARAETRRITLPAALRPQSIADGYAVRDAVTERLVARGMHVRGWKVGAADRVSEPSAAQIFSVTHAPGPFPTRGLGMVAVEAEVAAVFGQSLPRRDTPYRAQEVLTAVAELVVAIEVCDSRLVDWESTGDAVRLGDHQLNAGLVLGSGTAAFADIDFARQAMTMRVDGTVVKECVGCHAVGNPLTLLAWLANHASAGGGIKSGDAVTTGSWQGMHQAHRGAQVRVDFPGIGACEVRFEA